MKTTLTLLLLFLALFQVRAQENITEIPTIEGSQKVDVAAENRFLMRRLLLNEAQYLKVQEINTERNEFLGAVADMYRYDPEKRKEKLNELEIQYDGEFEAVLTKQQFSEYLAMHGRGTQNEPKPEPQEKTLLAGQPVDSVKLKELTFNDRIHAFLEKATAPRIDSSLIAKQDTTGFEPLSMDEESLLNGLGLLPQNATLLAIQAETAIKQDTAVKQETAIKQDTTKKQVASTLNRDGECKTCYSVEPDSINQKSAPISFESQEKSTETEVQKDGLNIAEIKSDTVWEEKDTVWEDNTEVVETETGNQNGNSFTEEPAAKDTIAVNLNPEEPGEEMPMQNAVSGNNKDALEIPADEVRKLRESLKSETENGTVYEEKTATKSIEKNITENVTKPDSESKTEIVIETPDLPVPNKLIAEELEP